MCGRFYLDADIKALVDFFEINQEQFDLPEILPRYNIAPSQQIAACRANSEGQRELALLRWGLIPHWAKEEKIGYKMINARAETVAEKPAYREAFKRRRCLIPATGFYEWKAEDKGKQPYNIHRRDGRLFAFAGLWEHWQGQEGEPVGSCTIIVGPPNDLVAKIHDRMPVVLTPDDFSPWLDAGAAAEGLLPLLIPAPAGEWESYPISKAVNKPANDGPELIERI